MLYPAAVLGAAKEKDRRVMRELFGDKESGRWSRITLRSEKWRPGNGSVKIGCGARFRKQGAGTGRGRCVRYGEAVAGG